MSQQQRSAVRPARIRTLAAVAGAVAGGLVAALVMVVAPAQAQVAIPVDCSTDTVVLRWDDVAYDLQGTCGVVRVEADHTEVSMPAATRLVVHGTGNQVTAKPLTELVVRGHDNTVRAPSVHDLVLASTGSVVRADGLVESARLGGRRDTLSARQLTDLVVRGRHHHVRARRGYHTRVPGNRNEVLLRRLDDLRVGGDHNLVRVRRGATGVRDSGTRNRIRVHRRG